jgi:hypothetical protein
MVEANRLPVSGGLLPSGPGSAETVRRMYAGCLAGSAPYRRIRRDIFIAAVPAPPPMAGFVYSTLRSLDLARIFARGVGW